MKNKIFKNREVLRGLNVNIPLLGNVYDFKINYADQKKLKISISFEYSSIKGSNPDTFEGIIDDIIIYNSADDFDYSRRAFRSSARIKKIPIVVDGVEFRFDIITNSNIVVSKVILLDDMLGAEDGTFLGNIKNIVLSNLLDNPPKHYERRYMSGYYFSSYFDFPFFGMSSRIDMSEEKLEKNRKKYKKQREEEKRKREKAKQLDKELGLDKRQNTRDLARFR